MKEFHVIRLGTISFDDAYKIQQEIVRSRIANPDNSSDSLILCEHNSVITLGHRGKDRNVLVPKEVLDLKGIPLCRTDRGGDVTYHGPGQLVGYPILRLEDEERDLHLYLRKIEEAIMLSLSRFGIAGKRKEGLTGVWVVERRLSEDKKICSIGVGVRKWVTFHGFALNVKKEALEGFKYINPCGIDACDAISMEQLSPSVNMQDVEDSVIESIGRVFNCHNSETSGFNAI